MKKRLISALLLGAVTLPLLQGCFPVVAAGVTTGVLSALDRRSLGTQTEDETIEWKASSLVTEKFGDKVHANFTSFNRKVLITGEVPSAEIKAEVDKVVATVNNVQGTYNELAVTPISAFSARSNDAFVTSKVKGRFVDYNRFRVNHVKVVTEAGVVFLLGLVTKAEADTAIEITRTTAGVRKVVNVMEIISDARARELDSSQQETKKNGEAKKTAEP